MNGVWPVRNYQVSWIRSLLWLPPRSGEAQTIEAKDLAPTKLTATDGKCSDLAVNSSMRTEPLLERFSEFKNCVAKELRSPSILCK